MSTCSAANSSQTLKCCIIRNGLLHSSLSGHFLWIMAKTNIFQKQHFVDWYIFYKAPKINQSTKNQIKVIRIFLVRFSEKPPYRIKISIFGVIAENESCGTFMSGLLMYVIFVNVCKFSSTAVTFVQCFIMTLKLLIHLACCGCCDLQLLFLF